jgi:uncharacterized membrane protein HdeD (DUF308 family)
MRLAITEYSSLSLDELNQTILHDIKDHRGWYIFEGFLFLALGLLAAALPGLTILATEVLVGVLLLFGGVVRLSNALRFQRGRWWRTFSGFVFLLAGAAMLWQPLAGLAALVTIFGLLLLLEGLIEVLLAPTYRPVRRWGILLLSGILSFLLGGLIFAVFPQAGVVMALFVGISMAFYGLSILLLALDA